MTNDRKASKTEDEYFAREDAERIRKLHAASVGVPVNVGLGSNVAGVGSRNGVERQ